MCDTFIIVCNHHIELSKHEGLANADQQLQLSQSSVTGMETSMDKAV